MQSIHKEISNIISRRLGSGTYSPVYTRWTIWTGPVLNINGVIEYSPGYDSVSHQVYAVSGSAFQALISGDYDFDIDTYETVRKRVLSDKNNDVLREMQLSKIDRSDEVNPAVGTQTAPNMRNTDTRLLELLTFAEERLYICTVDKDQAHGKGFDLTSGRVDPNKYEVEIQLLEGGRPIIDDVKILPVKSIPREAFNAVGPGQGIPVHEDLRSNLSADLKSQHPDNPENIAGKDKERITGSINTLNSAVESMFAGSCSLDRMETYELGDVWYGGLRTSLNRGFLELWTDEHGLGPMVKASRQAVKNAAAEYSVDIDPTSRIFGPWRIHPFTNIVPSTAITPHPVYSFFPFGSFGKYGVIIPDLFGFVKSIASIFKDDDDDFSFQSNYIDQGVFDYNDLYKSLEGTPIKE